MLIDGEEVFFPEQTNDHLIIYAPLRGYLAQASSALYDELIKDESDVKSSFIASLKKRPYFDPAETLHDLHHSVPGLSIPITDDCNLRCKYCYFCAGDEGHSMTMSTQQIQACVDSFFERLDSYSIWEAGNYLGVSIAGGGEPTCRFRQMRYAIDYVTKRCAERELIPRFSMPTNGMYGQPIREYIVQKFAHVSLSFDGPKFIHDRHRPTKSGNGSFDTVYETGKYFLRTGQSFTIRSTISSYSLNYIEDILNFFDKEFPGVKVGLEPLDDLGRARFNNDEIQPPDQDLFTARLQEAYRHADRAGMTVRNSSVGHFELLTPFFCRNASGPGWVFTSDGRIVACTRVPEGDEFCFGHYDEKSNKYLIDEERITSLRALTLMSVLTAS